MSARRAPRGDQTYWLTRDRIGGVLSDECCVWVVEPVRLGGVDGDGVWLTRGSGDSALDAACAGADYADDHDTCVDSWTVAEARREVGNGVPDSGLQCLRVGPRRLDLPEHQLN